MKFIYSLASLMTAMS